MGFLFAAARRPDDVQFHADGRQSPAALLPPLSERVFGRTPERRFLFGAVQEPIQCVQEPGKQKRGGVGAGKSLKMHHVRICVGG